MDVESPQPNDITEAIKLKEQELRFAFENFFYLIAFPWYQWLPSFFDILCSVFDKTHITLFQFHFMLIKLLTLRDRVCMKNRDDEKKLEREREKVLL